MNIISKKLFVETINELQKQFKHDDKCSNAFKIILPEDYVSAYDNHWIQNALIKLLQIQFDDKGSWIEYFIYDLNFGKEYKGVCVTDENGINIKLSSAGKLYDFLIANMK